MGRCILEMGMKHHVWFFTSFDPPKSAKSGCEFGFDPFHSPLKLTRNFRAFTIFGGSSPDPAKSALRGFSRGCLLQVGSKCCCSAAEGGPHQLFEHRQARRADDMEKWDLFRAMIIIYYVYIYIYIYTPIMVILIIMVILFGDIFRWFSGDVMGMYWWYIHHWVFCHILRGRFFSLLLFETWDRWIFVGAIFLAMGM